MTLDDLIKLHSDTCNDALETMMLKSSDYCGGSKMSDALANFKGASALGVNPVLGVLLRMQDKIMRIKSFTNDGKLSVKGEAVWDACDDLLNYSILCKALLIEQHYEEMKVAPDE